jgi:sn-glycerol 3-phosphate transport system substrate-binding protein
MKKILIALLFVLLSTTVFAKTTDIVFWHSLGFHIKEVVEDMVEEYNDTHPGVEVDAVFQGLYEELQVKMMTAAVTRQLPDVSQVQYEYLETYIENGLVQPIDKYLGSSIKEDIPQLLWDLVTRDNDIYGVPFCVSATMFYYNKDAFERAGLDPDGPPGNWDELVEMGKRLTADTDGDGDLDTYAMMFWTDGFYGLAPVLWSYGGEFFDSGNTRINLSSDEMVSTITMLRDLVYTHRIMPQNWTDWEGGQAFLTGNLAMGFFSSAGISYGEQNLPWELGIAPMPEINGTRQTALGGSGLLNFATKNRKKRAAHEFIEWMVSKENTIRIHEAIGYIPVRTSALNSLQLKAFHRDNPNYRITVEALAYARPLPQHSEYYKINAKLREMLERIFLQGADPQEELQKTEREINDMIN